MFKKLKAKIEEGGDSGIENVSFSERKLPGLAVRTTPHSIHTITPVPSQPVVSRSPSPGSHDNDEGVAVSMVNYERSLSVSSVR